VITAGFGKLVRIDFHLMLADYLLAVPLREHHELETGWDSNRILRHLWNLTLHIGDSALRIRAEDQAVQVDDQHL
jgi:hypothetical protein